MGRLARRHLRFEYFHVMVKAVHGEWLFGEEVNKRHYRKALGKFSIRFNVKIFAYCIMGNHAHILLKVDRVEDMSHFFKMVNHEFSICRNIALDRKGHSFMGRFISKPIFNTRYLVNCLAYIHNNPVNAGVAERAEDYEYSSMQDYKKQFGIVDFNEANLHYDASKLGVEAIMTELTTSNYTFDSFHKMLYKKYIIDKYFEKLFPGHKSIKSLNKVQYSQFAKEVLELEKITVKELADILGVNYRMLRYNLQNLKKLSLLVPDTNSDKKER